MILPLVLWVKGFGGNEEDIKICGRKRSSRDCSIGWKMGLCKVCAYSVFFPLFLLFWVYLISFFSVFVASCEPGQILASIYPPDLIQKRTRIHMNDLRKGSDWMYSTRSAKKYLQVPSRSEAIKWVLFIFLPQLIGT